MSYTPPKFPTGLRPGSRSPSAKPLQAALKKAGYLSKWVLASHNYGPMTQAAVRRFHKANPRYAEGPNDPAIGPQGWAELHREAYAPKGTASTGEPLHNYARTYYAGRTVNQRTRVMLESAAKKFGEPFTLSQGSYNKGVTASAGTHDGGGVVDVSVYGMTPAERSKAVLDLRRVGFAAWLRTPAEGFVYHIHACAIGDREMAPLARSQVQSYFNGRNGLRSNSADPVARPYPSWAKKYNQ